LSLICAQNYPKIHLLYASEVPNIEKCGIPFYTFSDDTLLLNKGKYLLRSIIDQDVNTFLSLLTDSIEIQIGFDSFAKKSEISSALKDWSFHSTLSDRQLARLNAKNPLDYYYKDVISLPYELWNVKNAPSVIRKKYLKNPHNSIRDIILSQSDIYIRIEYPDDQSYRDKKYFYDRVSLIFTTDDNENVRSNEILNYGNRVTLIKFGEHWEITSLFWSQ